MDFLPIDLGNLDEDNFLVFGEIAKHFLKGSSP